MLVEVSVKKWAPKDIVVTLKSGVFEEVLFNDSSHGQLVKKHNLFTRKDLPFHSCTLLF